MATETTEAAAGAAHGAEGAAQLADAAAHGAEQATGMPQLDVSTFPNQIFWLIVALGAIYYILDKIALPRIGAVLAERGGTITNDIAAAEELKLKAAEAEKAYQKALADARAEAQKIAAEARAAIQADLDEATERADAQIAEKTAESQSRIAEIRAGALQSVEAVAKDTAVAIAESLGRPADSAAIAAAVESKIKEGAA